MLDASLTSSQPQSVKIENSGLSVLDHTHYGVTGFSTHVTRTYVYRSLFERTSPFEKAESYISYKKGTFHTIHTINQDLAMAHPASDPSSYYGVSYAATYAYVCTALFTFYIVRVAILCRLSPLSHIPGPLLARFTRLWEVYCLWKYDDPTHHAALHNKYGMVSLMSRLPRLDNTHSSLVKS